MTWIRLIPQSVFYKVTSFHGVLHFGRNFFSPALNPLQDSKQEWNTAEVGVREKLEYLFGALGSSTVEYCR